MEIDLDGMYAPSHAGVGYRPVIDRAVRWVERLPGTGLPWIIGGSLLLGVLAHVPSWRNGELRVGTLILDAFFPVLFMAFFLGLIDVLDRIARGAFADFRVALGVPPQDADRLAVELTSIPDRQALATTVITTLVIGAGYAVDPGSSLGEAPLPSSLQVTSTALWLPANIAVALVLLHTLRQLRLVERLHAMAAHVDLLQPGPTHAFSRLTAATAVGILIVGILFAAPEASGTSTFGLLAGLAFTALAIASFGLPLAGMHGRLADEQARLMGEVNSRLRIVLAGIHQTVDSDDLGRADQLQKTQSALLAERDLYSRLSTWPWSTGTFRGLASAILLPIVIGLTLRLLTRVV